MVTTTLSSAAFAAVEPMLNANRHQPNDRKPPARRMSYTSQRTQRLHMTRHDRNVIVYRNRRNVRGKFGEGAAASIGGLAAKSLQSHVHLHPRAMRRLDNAGSKRHGCPARKGAEDGRGRGGG